MISNAFLCWPPLLAAPMSPRTKEYWCFREDVKIEDGGVGRLLAAPMNFRALWATPVGAANILVPIGSL